MAMGVGPMELAIVAALLFGGGGLSGVGVPLPPDAGLQSAAPAECLVYLAHQGAAKPDPKSANYVERLLAEPAIHEFSAELDRLAGEAVKQLPKGEEPLATATSTLPVIIKTLLARPSMLYVSSVDLPPAAPAARLGLVIAAGEHAPALREALLAWERLYFQQLGRNGEATITQVGTAELRQLPLPPDLPPIVPPVVWGVDGQYVFITVGKGEADDLVQRLAAGNDPPAWLKQLHDDAAIPRLGELAYVNVAGIMQLVDPLIDQFAPLAHPLDVRKLITQTGLPHIRYAAAAGGLDDSVSVVKLLVGHDEDAPGILALLDEKPLAKSDFVEVPRVADFAVVARCDAAAGYRRLLDLVDVVDAEDLKDWNRNLERAERELGFHFERDLLAALGDRWSLYNSPSEGGSLLTGLCLVASIRDRAKADLVIERLLRVAATETERGGKPAFIVNKTMLGEQAISYLQFIKDPIPVAPAWHLSDDRLVFAMSPQMVRVHLSRAADAPTLADVPQVAKQLAAGDVTVLNYSDGRGTATMLYSYLQYLATMGASALVKETGIQADLSKFPSYSVIAPHLQPGVSVVRRRKTVLSLESYSVGPALGPAAPLLGAGTSLAMFGIRAKESQAQVFHSANNLRQLTFASFSYANDKHATLPRVIRDADGKPLLSWRVALLPHLDQQTLYDQFHLDEPWDGEHNKPLVALMPDVYRHSLIAFEAGSGRTVFQIPRGKGTLYDGDSPPTEAEIDRLPIGRGQTVLFVETTGERAVEWTKPDDVELTPDTIFERLHVQPDGEIQAAMNDGSILTLSKMLDPELLVPMFFPRRAQ